MLWRRREPEVKRDPKATAARIAAERELAEKHDETRRIEAMTAAWRRIRERNHFASAIEDSFRGGHT